jgi:hypothetical protein
MIVLKSKVGQEDWQLMEEWSLTSTQDMTAG